MSMQFLFSLNVFYQHYVEGFLNKRPSRQQKKLSNIMSVQVLSKWNL